MPGRIISVNTSPNKGEKKLPTRSAVLVMGGGIQGDAHFGTQKQVSILAQESIDKKLAIGIDLRPGDFGENLTIKGLDSHANWIGRRLIVGSEVILQISEVGKVCVNQCSIGKRLGECIMPKEGIFAKVLRGGTVTIGDMVEPTAIKVAAVLTSSDRCASGARKDESGPLLIGLLQELGVTVTNYSVLPDEEAQLTERLTFLADRCATDIILTTGGTGLSPRDRMPEATLAVIESPAPGISEAIRQDGMTHTALACLSRGVSGLRGRTLIINLPGSRRAIGESSTLLRKIIPHALEIIRAEVSDCGM